MIFLTKRPLLLVMLFSLMSLSFGRSPAVDPMVSIDNSTIYQAKAPVDQVILDGTMGYNFEYKKKSPVRGNENHLMHSKHFLRGQTKKAQQLLNSGHPYGFIWVLVAAFFFIPFLVLKQLAKTRVSKTYEGPSATIIDFQSVSQRKKVSKKIDDDTKWKKTG